MHGDVKAVEDVQRVAGFLRHHRQVRLPQVAANEAQSRGPVAAEPAEEPEQGLDAALRADPEQPLAPLIDLVHERQVPMAPLPLDLVNADRLDAREMTIGSIRAASRLDNME